MTVSCSFLVCRFVAGISLVGIHRLLVFQLRILLTFVYVYRILLPSLYYICLHVCFLKLVLVYDDLLRLCLWLIFVLFFLCQAFSVLFFV
ncbi:hypothetical protein Hanom_Chr02g00124241 [Helianthus anomalus]